MIYYKIFHKAFVWGEEHCVIEESGEALPAHQQMVLLFGPPRESTSEITLNVPKEWLP